MQVTKLRPGKDHTVTVNEEILSAHPSLKKIVANSFQSGLLFFWRRRNRLLRFGFGLCYLPPDRRGFRRHFLAIQISDATPTFHSDPMLLTHEAFYRTKGVSTQREIKQWAQMENQSWSTIGLPRPAGSRTELRDAGVAQRFFRRENPDFVS
jgi:hypothetical protein